MLCEQPSNWDKSLWLLLMAGLLILDDCRILCGVKITERVHDLVNVCCRCVLTLGAEPSFNDFKSLILIRKFLHKYQTLMDACSIGDVDGIGVVNAMVQSLYYFQV